jgi:hypothetical protein
MKAYLTTSILLFLSAFLHMQIANAANLKIEGVKAKKLYQSLVGPAVQNDGAAGHIYRIGKSIVCRYTTAEMDDKYGHSIKVYDPRRYACSIKFNSNGFAKPGNNP